MKIKLSDHAKKQAQERKIPRNYILQAVDSPQKMIKSYRNRELRQRQFSGKILEVVTVQEEDLTVVITEYYLEEEI